MALVAALIVCEAARAGVPHAAVPSGDLAYPIRLSARLATAHVDAPWRDAGSLVSGTQVASELVWRETFDDFSPADLGWTGSESCVGQPGTPVARPGGVLRYGGRQAYRCVVALPAAPGQTYRVRRKRLAPDTRIDFAVIESSAALRHPGVLNHPADLASILNGRFVPMQDLLWIHRFATASAPHGWQEDALTLYTSPQTKTLVLLLQDVEATLVDHPVEAFFDDIEVVRLLPATQQRLAWLAASDPAAGVSAPNAALVKRGQLLPVGHVDGADRDLFNFDFRTSLLAPTPTRLVFPLRVRPGARLRFSNGLHKTSQPGDAVTFKVRVQLSDEPAEPVFARTLRVGNGGGWRWYDATVSLEAYSGKDVRLILETSGEGERGGIGLWSDPIVDSPRPSQAPPNVLFIAVDTLRTDHLSAYGYKQETSPNIAALAADGARFTQAIATSNWTSPSFASMFTGLLPSQHRVVHRARAIPPDVTTLAEVLQKGGWITQGIAFKPYLYNMGFDRGFDRWFNVPRLTATADDTLNCALEWLRVNGDRRFFLFLHFNDPHQPFNQPKPFDTLFVDETMARALGYSLPIVIDPMNKVRGCARCGQRGRIAPAFKKVAKGLYDGEVAYMDSRVGRLLQVLRERHLYDDTVIVFVSDHGEVMWEHGNYFGHGGPAMVDTLVRVPLLIKPAARAQIPARVVSQQVRLHDLMPTILQLVALPSPSLPSDARSLVPLMVGEAEPPRVALSENIKQQVLAVRYRGHKYVLQHRADQTARQAYFDLRADPNEKKNLLATAPVAEIQPLRTAALEHLLTHGSGPFVVITGTGDSGMCRVDIKGPAPQTLFAAGEVGRGQGHGLHLRAPCSESPLYVGRVAAGHKPLRVALRGRAAGKQDFAIFFADPLPYEPGSLSASTGRAWAVGGRGGGPRDRTPVAENARRLEALKALGYVQ